MPRFAHGCHERAAEQDQHGADETGSDDDRRQPDDDPLQPAGCEEDVHYHAIVPDALPSPDSNYSSGNDYIVEFLGYRFSFGATDFEGRVVAAAVKLGVVETADLDDDETADLVSLAAQGVIDEPQSRLGRYLVRNWERVSLVEGESLVYWLRKLIFRGAWLDHQVKRSALEVVWDDDEAEFAYQHPGGGRPLLELAPVPSWHELQFRP
jgi:hypothetical protein